MAYRIPEETIEEVRAQSDIVEIISEYVPLRRKGKNYFGLCPFHVEKTPSFSVNPEKQIYHCFGCGVGGNVFSFLMESQKISFPEAVRILAKRAGITLPEQRVGPIGGSVNDPLYRANELAQKYFHHLLTKDNRAEKARRYLETRRVSEQIVERFGLGYALSAWDGFLTVAAKRSLSGEVLEKAGLAIKKEFGGFYDRFRDRIMFPIRDLSGRTVAFGARTLDDSQQPKYLNSPETPIYHKGSVLYGLRQARDAIRTAGRAIIVEGYTDLLRLVQKGMENTVASSGTALTSEQAKLLSRYTDRATIVYDADVAGSAATMRGIDILLEAGLSVNIVSLPQGHDPDSFIREKGVDSFRRLIEQAQENLDYKLKSIAATQDLATIDGKREAVSMLVETALKVKDEIRRDLLVKEISEKLEVNEAAIHREMARLLKKQRTRGLKQRPQKSTKVLPEGSPAERELVKMMIGNPELSAKVMEKLKVSDFSEGAYRKIAETIFRICREGRRPDPAVLIDSPKDSLPAALISKLASEGFDEDRVEESLTDCIRRIKIDAISSRQKQIEVEIREAQARGDQSLLGKLNEESYALAREKLELAREKT